MAKSGNSSARGLVILCIRFMLLCVIIASLIYGRDLILLLSMLGLAFTFIPYMLKTFFDVEIPAEFEIIVLLFLYGVFILAEKWGFYADIFWISIVLNIGEGLLLGFVGVSVLYALENEDLLELTPFVIVFFTFCFSFSIGGLWEIFEYVIDSIFWFSLQRGSVDEVMIDLLSTAVAALFIAILALYNYQKGRRIFSTLLFGAVKKHRNLFGKKRNKAYFEKMIDKIIRNGEGEKIEFKSTFRKNLHTKEIDKKIEHSALKTIVGFLNAKGGTLLVGVSDDGTVRGVEDDNFDSHDKFRIYLTGLLRSAIGNQNLSLVSFEIYNYKGKDVLKISCQKSNRRVFLKWQGNEEFFVRHGASTLQLQGSALIDYVSQRFG